MTTTTTIPYIPFDTLYPCRYEVMTFSEKELTNSWLNKVWGYILTMFGGDVLQMVISAVDAKNIYDRYTRERWSNKKLVEEVKKVAKYERNTTRTIWSISGILSLLGVTGAGILTATGAVGAATAGAALAPYLLLILVSTIFGVTLGGWLAKRGFIRIMEGYTEKNLMDKM